MDSAVLARSLSRGLPTPILTDSEARLAAGKPIDNIASVASFFLSRIDTLADKQIDDLASKGKAEAKKLRGTAAIASACRAYGIYEEPIASSRWKALESRGARKQRLLWASTSNEGSDLQPDQVC